MISVANKWMYLLSRAKGTSQADFAKKIFESNLNGYLKNIIFTKRDRLNAADLIEVDSVFNALIKEYEIGGNNEYSK